jgi:hypothetical protein
VIDASGLNDKRAAHWPAPGPIDWGKGGVAYALERKPEAIAWGWPTLAYHDYKTVTMSEQQLLGDTELAEHVMGRAMPLGELEAMGRAYRRAQVCGVHAYCMNLWLRPDVARRLEGRDDVEIAPESVTSTIPLEGFWDVESEGETRWRWTRGMVGSTWTACRVGMGDNAASW